MINILMTEDNPKFAELLTEYLTQYTINVTNYEDPYLGLSAGVKKYNLLILDLTLPGMDGLEFWEEVIRKYDIPVIISSALSDIQDKVAGFEIGSDDYLTKHYDPKEIYARITTSSILRDEGYEVTLLNRSAKRLEKYAAQGFKTYTFETFDPQQYDLVINMTSAGLEDNNLPAPLEILDNVIPQAYACVDVIYGKETPFLKLAKSHHKPTKDGSDMLLYQGIIAFEYFTSHTYTFEDIKPHMQKALTL